MKIFILALTLVISGCASYEHISDSQETWVLQKIGREEAVFFCMPNKSSDSNFARPVCHVARLNDGRATFTIEKSNNSGRPNVGN